MKIAKVTNNGRITLPAELRKKYGLYAGRKVKFEICEDGLKIISLVTKKEIKANVGFLGTKDKMLKFLMEEKKFERNF